MFCIAKGIGFGHCRWQGNEFRFGGHWGKVPIAPIGFGLLGAIDPARDKIPLLDLLLHLRTIGVNHVGLNLKYGERPATEVLEEIGQEILPHIHPSTFAIAH